MTDMESLHLSLQEEHKIHLPADQVGVEYASCENSFLALLEPQLAIRLPLQL